MEKRKLSLKSVNDGEHFVLPTVTVKIQEKYMEKLAEIEKKDYSDDKQLSESNKALLLTMLQEIDPSVGLSDIENLHPADFMTLVEEINNTYMEGREIVDEEKPKKK
jgi:hypothetical protein